MMKLNVTVAVDSGDCTHEVDVLGRPDTVGALAVAAVEEMYAERGWPFEDMWVVAIESEKRSYAVGR